MSQIRAENDRRHKHGSWREQNRCIECAGFLSDGEYTICSKCGKANRCYSKE